MNTTFLVGNGAIQGGWEPIKRAIQETFGKCPEQEPNFAFASLTHQLRWLKYQAQKRDNRFKDAFNSRLYKYNKLKCSISNEILKAAQSGLMTVHNEFALALDRFSYGHTEIATTNWDLLLEQYLNSTVSRIIYVHGNVKNPESLYLPTENIVEQYRHENDESELHSFTAGHLLSVLQNTDRLIIYGLSLSPLDVELALLLVDGFHNTNLPSEVVVIDLNPALIVERLHYLGITKIPHCYLPIEI